MHTDHLLEIADLFNLKRLLPINLVPIRYVDDPNDSNSIINLIFLKSYSEEFNTYSIPPNIWSSSDYAPLIVNIAIQEEFIQKKDYTSIRGARKRRILSNNSEQVSRASIIWILNIVNH